MGKQDLPGTGRSIANCIAGNFLFRMSAEATSIMLGLYLSYINNHVHPIAAFVVGVIGTGYFILQLIGAPAMGALSDIKGRKLLMILGPLISAGVVLLYPTTTFMPVIFMLLTFEGLNAAMRAPAALSYLSDMTSGSDAFRGRAMGLYQMSILTSMVAGYVLGGLFWDKIGPAAFRGIAVTYLLGVGVIWLGVVEKVGSQNRSRHGFREYLWVATRPAVFRFLPAWVGLNAILSAWLSQTTFQLSAHSTVVNQALLGRFSGVQIGIIMAVMAILFTGGTVGWGLLIGRLHKITIMLLASFGIYLCCAALLTINHLPLDSSGSSMPLMILAAIILGAGIFAQSGFTPAAFVYLGDISGKFIAERGAIIGVYYLFLSAGQLLGIWLGGAAAQVAQLDGLVFLSASLVSVVLATLLVIRLRPIMAEDALVR